MKPPSATLEAALASYQSDDSDDESDDHEHEHEAKRSKREASAAVTTLDATPLPPPPFDNAIDSGESAREQSFSTDAGARDSLGRVRQFGHVDGHFAVRALHLAVVVASRCRGHRDVRRFHSPGAHLPTGGCGVRR